MLGKSPDGFSNWQFYQIRIQGTQGWPGRPCDPDIILKNDTFRLYFTGDPYNDMRPETYSAISLDGINFIRQSNYFADSLMLANGIKLTNGYRFFGFRNLPPGGIRSLYSLDGEDWTIEPGYRLQIDTTSGLESLAVKDPAVVFKDTVFIMYYVTRKRMTGIEEKGFIKDNRINFEVFPNPSQNRFEIRLNPGYIKNQKVFSGISIKIFDIMSSLVHSWDNILVGETDRIFWYGDNGYGIPVNPGIYFICLEDNSVRKRTKIILIK